MFYLSHECETTSFPFFNKNPPFVEDIPLTLPLPSVIQVILANLKSSTIIARHSPEWPPQQDGCHLSFHHLTLKSSLGSTFPSAGGFGIIILISHSLFSCVVCPFFIIRCLLCTAVTNVTRRFNRTLRIAALFHHYVSTAHLHCHPLDNNKLQCRKYTPYLTAPLLPHIHPFHMHTRIDTCRW